MRKALAIFLLLGTASCSGGDSSREQTTQRSEDLKTFDASEDSAAVPPSSAPNAPPAPPGIAPTAAPGVAFNYRYAFRLAGARIGPVQEQHAQTCEKLGVAKCRITAMRYRLVDEDEIEGMLAFKLDPALARAFGKDGIDAVTRAEGMLVDAEITGEDAGSRIAAATRSQAELEEELKRIEEQLARRGLGSSERAELQLRAQQLRDQIRATRTTTQEQQETLATTPVVFHYGSGDLLAGFDGRPRLRQAFENATENFIGGLLWILVALITLLPWALVLGGLVWIWRRLLPRINRAAAGPAPEAIPEA